MAQAQKLLMLGPSLEGRRGVASLVGAWREHGLFERWPITYVATHSPSGAWLRSLPAQAKLFGLALRRFGEELARERRLALHVHAAAREGFWRQGAFLALAPAARGPLVLQLHGGGFERFYDASWEPVQLAMRLALERADCVLVPCESLRAWVRSLARHARVETLPSAGGAWDAARPEPSNVVLYLGRLSAEKGVYDLVEAMAAVRSAAPDARLVCAGEGDHRALSRHAARLGIAEAVKLVGTVGPSGKRALFETASALALPSYSEGMPMALLEAMAAGVPVVASPVGGIPELIADGTSGFLAAAGDKAGLARALKKLLLDRALGARVGAAGRETVRKRHSAERSVGVLESVYAGLGIAGGIEVPEQAPQPRMREAA